MQSVSGMLNGAQSPNGGMQIGALLAGSPSQGYIPIDSNKVNVGTSRECEATVTWKTRYIFADQWCRTQCAAGNCPVQYCKDACRNIFG